MATSGSYDFNLNTLKIIQRAYSLLGIYVRGQSLPAHQLTDALEALNSMIRSWDTDGLHLWKYKEGTLFLEQGVYEYNLGPAITDSNWAHDPIETTLSAAEASGQTVLSVASNTGMATSDIVGIVLADGTTQWQTISSVGSGTITINSALTGNANSGARVYTFTTRAQRPLRIHSIRRRSSSANDIPLQVLSRQEYFDLPDKASTGTISQYYYDPQLTSGILRVYQAPNNTSDRLMITYSQPLQDFDATTNDPELPAEWLDAIVYNLATRLAPNYGKEDKVLKIIGPVANQLYSNLLSWDSEVTSVFIEPMRRS